MTELLIIAMKGFWCGCAALGFGILFNAPRQSLLYLWIGGFVAGIVKFGFLSTAIGAGIVLSSFMAGLFVGIVATPIARLRDVPIIIIAIPSIIPLVPGVFAYRAMMGLMKLARNTGGEYLNVMAETVYNGVMALFVIVAITLGLALALIARRFIPQLSKKIS